MEEKIYTLKAYGETKKIRLQETAYVDGNRPQTDKKGRKAFVQTDKYLEFVLDNNLGVVTGGNARSGYNHYTEIEFI